MFKFGPFTSLTIDPDDPSVDELRDIVDEFDALMDKCMTPGTPLTNEEAHALNELYGALETEEEEYWEDVHPGLVTHLQSRAETDFPTIRFILKMKSNED